MNQEAIVRAIQDVAQGRFDVEGDGIVVERIHALASTALTERAVIRLRRSGRDAAGWHTVLVASVSTSAGLPDVLNWAADSRDALSDPEPADLQLVVLGHGLTRAECSRLEADEQFCRKYALTEGESLADVLGRSLLGRAGALVRGDRVQDPLSAALGRLAGGRAWMTTDVLHAWRDRLLSDDDGSDVGRELLGDVPESMP